MGNDLICSCGCGTAKNAEFNTAKIEEKQVTKTADNGKKIADDRKGLDWSKKDVGIMLASGATVGTATGLYDLYVNRPKVNVNERAYSEAVKVAERYNSNRGFAYKLGVMKPMDCYENQKSIVQKSLKNKTKWWAALGVAAGIGAYALYKVCENKFSTPDKP